MSNAARKSVAMKADNFDEQFEAIISEMDNHRMQMNGMQKDLLCLLQKAAADFGGARLDTAITENNALKEQVHALKKRVEKLEDENKRLGNDNARLSKDHSQLDKDYAMLQDDLRDAEKKNRDLEEKLSESEQTLSQFMALSSRVASANPSHKRAAEDNLPTQSKKTRHLDATPSKDFHQDDTSHCERSRNDTGMESISRREFRDYSLSERPIHDSISELRSCDDIYSNSGNPQDKVSDYLARLPTSTNTRDDVSSLERNKTPFPSDDINIRGKANIQNCDKVPQHSAPARDNRHSEGIVEEHNGAKVWRRNNSNPSTAQNRIDTHGSAAVTSGASSDMNQGNGTGPTDDCNVTERNSSKSVAGGHDTFFRQNRSPSNQTQNVAPQRPQNYNHRRRIVCHACWEVRGRCDNRHTCGNCAADGMECVRTLCSDYTKHGICPRGTACFKVHDEHGYKAVNFSPFNHQENKWR